MVRSLMLEGLLVLAVALAFAGCGPSASNETAMENTTAKTPVTEADPADKADSDETIVNSIGMKLVLIPAGEFMMGEPAGAAQHQVEVLRQFGFDNELFMSTQHQVKLTRPFYLGVTEVTQEQYQRVMGSNPSSFKGNLQRPVDWVSWEDAMAFCRKLTDMDGHTYRLPTEAEWEYACRGGTTTEYSFGDEKELLGEYGWFSGNSNGQTQPVGAKKPNPWGLYDMHGNVWEWCQDWYSTDYYKQSPAANPQGPVGGFLRVHRGGGWFNPAEYCRSAFRDGFEPDNRADDLGFRVVRSPSGKEGKPAGQPASKSGAGSGGRGGSNAQQERRGEVMSEEQSSAKKAVPSRDEISARVRPILVAALGVDEHEITPKATLVSDLGADGFDFLELVFRLEKEFGIEIPWNEMYPEEVLTNPKYVQAGRVNEAGLAELRRRLPFADLDRFAQNPRVPQPIVFPDFYTVDGLVRYVQSKL